MHVHVVVSRSPQGLYCHDFVITTRITVAIAIAVTCT